MNVTTQQYGPILSHVYYGGRGGVSPDDLWHYTDVGEMLIPDWFNHEVHAHARALGIFDDPDNMDDPDKDTCPGERREVKTHSCEPEWVTQYNAAYTWDELLEGDGWRLKRICSTGTRHWTRPGKNLREGSSATTGHNGIDKLHVFSTSIDWLPCGRYSRWAYMVYRDFARDFRAASRAIRAVRG